MLVVWVHFGVLPPVIECLLALGHLAFRWPRQQFGKTCALSALCALSRPTEIVRGMRGMRGKVLGFALACPVEIWILRPRRQAERWLFEPRLSEELCMAQSRTSKMQTD
jgi:hypothetical protein